MEVLACPFCGNAKVICNKNQENEEYVVEYYAACSWCGARGAAEETVEEAIEVWNLICRLVAEARDRRELLQ